MPLPKDAIENYNAVRKCRDKRSLCHAPSYSMYFGRDGYVSACCYSRANPLGRYPEQSISEIWFGSKTAELRRRLRCNELPSGCETCAEQLIARNLKGLLAGQFDSLALSPRVVQIKGMFQTGAAERYPSRLEFELSNKCNLECQMCSGFFSSSIRSNREGLPALPMVYDRGFVEQLREFVPHLKEAKFYGGEPFLVDLYYEIWELCIEANPSCNVFITTNGTVYTEKVKRVMEHLNCEIILSLDSLNQKTYESIRQNASFARTMSNLEEFAEINRKKGKTLTLAVCPMTSNWRELPAIVEFANDKGTTLFFNTVVLPREMSLKSLRVQEQAEIIQFLRGAMKPPANATQATNQQALEDLCRQVEHWMVEKENLRWAAFDFQEQCRKYSEECSTEQRPVLSTLFSVLASEGMTGHEVAEALSVHDGPDTRLNIRQLYTAIWTVGRMLVANGRLTAGKYDEKDLRELLELMESSFPEQMLPAIHDGTKRYAMDVLRFAGITPPRLFVKKAVEHFARSLS
jgi:MoaA/NifB/PqqE/SkfB family radical SAM enzyme